MNYKRISISIIVIFLVLVAFISKGNLFRYNDISSLMKKPETLDLQVEGLWKLKNIESLVENEISIESESLKNIYISKDFVKFGKNYTDFPKFKFRYINFDKYLVNKGISNSKKKINEDKVVVTVDDGDFFYQEFLKIDENNIVVIYNKHYLHYELDKKDFDKDKLDKHNSERNSSKFVNSENMDSTFLIGFRTEDLKYETIIVRKNFKEKEVAKKSKGVFINRNNDFFIIDNILNSNNTQKGVYITSDYLRVNNEKFLETEGIITYVGKYYMSLENTKNPNGQKSYEIRYNDDLIRDVKITILGLAGENGRDSYYDSLRKINNNFIGDVYKNTDNIGVHRKNSKWVFRSVFNDNLDNKLTSTEFDLDIIPLIPVFEINSIRISNTDIKNRVRDYVDYFISPKENLIVILNSEKLFLYNVENGEIDKTPILSIPINPKGEVIMFQWELNENSSFTFGEFMKLKTEDIEIK